MSVDKELSISVIDRIFKPTSTDKEVVETLKRFLGFVCNGGNSYWVIRQKEKWPWTKFKNSKSSFLNLCKLPLGPKGKMIGLFEIAKQNYRSFEVEL